MTQTEYDFADLTSILKAISGLPEDDKAEYNRCMNQVEKAANRFLKARTNSELMDMAGEVVHIGGDEVSLYDYMGSFSDWYDAEVGCRNWPIADQVMKVVKEWGPEWTSDDDSLRERFFAMEKQVRGIQKKVDRIAELLKDAKFTISGETALKL